MTPPKKGRLMKSTIQTSKSHAFIDGVLLGLSVSAIKNDVHIEKFLEVVDNADPDLGEFARQQAREILADRNQELLDTFEVIYFTD